MSDDPILRSSWNAALDAAITKLNARVQLWQDGKMPIRWSGSPPTPDDLAMLKSRAIQEILNVRELLRETRIDL